MLAPFYDRVRVSTPTTGSGTLTFGSASIGFLDFTNVPTGEPVRYVIEDLPNWEIGQGVKASSTTFTRTTVKETSAGTTSPISLSGSATLYLAFTSDSFIDAANVLHNTFPASAYGAYFDGINDDAPGISAAITAANAAGGGIVLLPPGSGLLGSGLTQPYNNVHIVGAGVPQLAHNTGGSYDVGTALKWTGSTGGTMLTVGPAQDPVAGKRKSNCSVRGVLFDGNNIAGICVQIQSVAFSKFDFGYVNPLVCGCLITTVWLESSMTAGSWEINDTQFNEFRIDGLVNYPLANTVATTLSTAGTTVAFDCAAGFFAGMQVRFATSVNYYIIASVSGNNVTFTSAVTVADATAGNKVAFAPGGVVVTGVVNSTVPSGYHVAGSCDYPACWCGNSSLNQFRQVSIINYAGGDGFTFQYTDHNYVDLLVSYTSSPTAYGLVFDGGVGTMPGAR
jgi:hypothetical protein